MDTFKKEDTGSAPGWTSAAAAIELAVLMGGRCGSWRRLPTLSCGQQGIVPGMWKENYIYYPRFHKYRASKSMNEIFPLLALKKCLATYFVPGSAYFLSKASAVSGEGSGVLTFLAFSPSLSFSPAESRLLLLFLTIRLGSLYSCSRHWITNAVSSMKGPDCPNCW